MVSDLIQILNHLLSGLYKRSFSKALPHAHQCGIAKRINEFIQEITQRLVFYSTSELCPGMNPFPGARMSCVAPAARKLLMAAWYGALPVPGRNQNQKGVPTSASPQRPRVQRVHNTHSTFYIHDMSHTSMFSYVSDCFFSHALLPPTDTYIK